MHVKYAFLQFSYSVPVRVSVVARATTFAARVGVVAVRDVTVAVSRFVFCFVLVVAVLDTVFGAEIRVDFVVALVAVRTRCDATP